jgi:hypothetical protein
MTEIVKIEKSVASNDIEALKRLDELNTKDAKSAKSTTTRKKSEVKVKDLNFYERSQKELEADIKKNSCKNRFYYRTKTDNEAVVRVNTTYINPDTQQREDFSKEVAILKIDAMFRYFLLTKQKVIFTSRDVVDFLQVCGASYTDSIRNAVKFLATLQFVKFRALKHDAVYSKTKKAFVLNVEHATYSDIIETLSEAEKATVKANLKEAMLQTIKETL